MRLNKFIAASGICSRREADQLITAGLVKVNGKTITELGTKVNPGDDVRYNGERMRNEQKVYLLLNKPKDYVTTTDDPKERKIVMTLIKNACQERIYPVGRLDRNTTGVLLFTNDGEMAKKLTHPGHNKKKIYHIFLEKAFAAGDMKKLAEGITLDDGFIQPDAISYVSSEHKREIGLEIHSGRNRIVRRMFESLGYRVMKLDRVYFAGLTKKNLSRGKWRFLTDKEISMATLVKQPTARPTRKKMFQDVAQFLLVGAAFALGMVGVDIPAGLEGLAVGAAGTIIGYYVRDAI